MATLENLGHELDEVPWRASDARAVIGGARAWARKTSESKRRSGSRRGGGGGVAAAGVGGGAAEAAGAVEGEGVGDEDLSKSRGMAIGVAPDGARPATSSSSRRAARRRLKRATTRRRAGRRGGRRRAAGAGGGVHSVQGCGGSRGEHGAAHGESCVQECAAGACRRRGEGERGEGKIDEVKAQLDAKKVERLEANRYVGEEAEIIDEEEFMYIQTLKEAKGSYKASHEAMRARRRRRWRPPSARRDRCGSSLSRRWRIAC